MDSNQETTNNGIPIIGGLIKSPPSPIIIGTVTALAIVILFIGPWYAPVSNPNGEAGQNYISFNQLSNDYDQSTNKFRSYDPGDVVYVKDIVLQSSYDNITSLTELTFNAGISIGTINVYGNISEQYPPGTQVIVVIRIIEEMGYEIIKNPINQSEIWEA